METLVVVAHHRNHHYSRSKSLGSNRFGSSPSRGIIGINCRTFESGSGILPSPPPKSRSDSYCETLSPRIYSEPQKAIKRSNPIAISPRPTAKGLNFDDDIEEFAYSELWAGPAYSNSPPPSSLPVTRKASDDFSKLPSNGGRVQCMKVWPIEGVKKFETLSYLPELTVEQLIKQIEYLLRNNWVPCLEFCKIGFVYRKYHASPGYYDGRYWTMWKLPMFGCTDAVQVVKELDACKAEYGDAFIRIIGFDNNRQVQCVSFIAYKPASKDYY